MSTLFWSYGREHIYRSKTCIFCELSNGTLNYFGELSIIFGELSIIFGTYQK